MKLSRLTAGLLSAMLLAAVTAPAAVAAPAPVITAVDSAEMQRVRLLIAQLIEKITAAEAAAVSAGDDYHAAQQEFFEAAIASDGAVDHTHTSLGPVIGPEYVSEPFFLDDPGRPDTALRRLVLRNEYLFHHADEAQAAQRRLGAAQGRMQRAQDRQEAAEAETVTLRDQLAVLEAQQAALAAGKTGPEAEKAARAERERQAKAQAGKITGGGGSAAPTPTPTPKVTVKPQVPNTTVPVKTKPVKKAQKAAGWARPSKGNVSSGFGPRHSTCGPNYCSSSYHYGLDLAAACNSPIVAATAGKVVYAGYNGGYGNYVKIDHGDGLATGYAHIVGGGFLVHKGDKVDAGQQIAKVGNTGNSFGCHLHFEVYKNGKPFNPVPFLRARGLL